MAVDTVALQEADTLYIGRPAGFAVDPDDGTFYVSHGYARTVVRYDRDGVPVKVYGRPGSGPGEFELPGDIVVLDRRKLAVVEETRTELIVYDRMSGELDGAIPVDGALTSAAVVDDAVWMGALAMQRNAAVARWDTATDAVTPSVGLPREYLESGALAGIFRTVSTARTGDRIVVGVGASDELRVVGTDGVEQRTIRLPAVRRRGGATDEFVENERGRPFPELFSAVSVLASLHTRTDGTVLLVHRDQEIDGADITGTVYLSALAPDLERACVDGPLPVAYDAIPHFAARGDTLFVLEQSVDDGGTATRVRSLLVSTDRCMWQPVASDGGSAAGS